MAEFLEFDEDWGRMVQDRVRTTMDELEMWASGEVETDTDIATPSGYLYCGCEVCYEREHMYLMMVLVLQGARDGLVRLVADET